MTHSHRLVALFGCLISFTACADSTVTFVLPSDVEVTVVEAAFNANKFAVEGCSESSSICRINGRIPYGVAFGLPKTYVKRITVSFHDSSYDLNVADMYNAWGDRPIEYPGAVRYFGGKCFDKKNCQFRGVFSDAAGSFAAEWLIVDGYSSRSILTSSSDVVKLFMKNIDPPEFD